MFLCDSELLLATNVTFGNAFQIFNTNRKILAVTKFTGYDFFYAESVCLTFYRYLRLT